MSTSLLSLAAAWRDAEVVEPIISRHEYDSQNSSFSGSSLMSGVGQVGQVGQVGKINDLDPNSLTYRGRSVGGSGRSPGYLPLLPDVPPAWISGVYALQRQPAPGEISQSRWVRFRFDALRLLHERGAELHAAGWSEVDVFGLHPTVPDRAYDCMGLAWVARRRAVTAVTQDEVAMQDEDGTVLRARRLVGRGAVEAVAAWSW